MPFFPAKKSWLAYFFGIYLGMPSDLLSRSTSLSSLTVQRASSSSVAGSRGTCHCEAAAVLHDQSHNQLQTRGELLTQQKKQPSDNVPSFDLDRHYDILSVLGEGSYGMVYRAKRKSDGRLVALKTMPREFTGQTDFEREVAALQLLCNENQNRERNEDASVAAGRDRIIQLYDLHRDDENYYLAMELVEGGELFDHLISGGPFSEATAASFLRQFAEGISYAHGQGLVHADLKPENLMLTTTANASESQDDNHSEERVSLKLVDFGCAVRHDSSKKELHLPAQEFATGCSFLHMVALGNQFELERMLMDRPGLVNFRDYDFRTPLHLAASEGHVDICRFLVAKGAQINRVDRWGGSPLDDAHRHKHAAVVQYLREHKAQFGNTATAITKLVEAASAGDVDEVRALLEFGTTLDINQGDYDKRTALHLAASEGRLKVVELLVCQEGADVNVEDRWGNRPLDDAKRAKENSAEIVKLLKSRGAASSGSSVASKPTNKQKQPKVSLGTTAYWPPEMFLQGASPTPPADMWAW